MLELSSVLPGSTMQYVSDIENGWKIELSCLFIALFIGYVYLVLMRFCTGAMTWAVIIAYHAILVTIGVLCWTTS